MRRKELRIALVCYGGVSLAVYMHGVTKEVWHLARAGMACAGDPLPGERVYARALAAIERASGLRVAVLADIVAGASAGGVNTVFLAQAIQSGQSLEPLTRLWLERADIEHLLGEEDNRWSGMAKQWLAPLMLGRRLAGASPEDREIRAKIARFVRARWFEAPFSGIGLSRLIARALDEMAAAPIGPRLLPEGHPLDLFTTATDCTGYRQRIALHSPAWVEEREHRLSVDFHAISAGDAWASLPELVFAARATASFPGAFPPLQLGEIDRLVAERQKPWPGRDQFLARIMPAHVASKTVHTAALMDGSVLVNAPFGPAIAALSSRPAQVEVDRRLVYVDPNQAGAGDDPADKAGAPPGFFPVIFRALSTIPREQPIRDNLESLARQSAALERVQAIAASLQGEVEKAVREVLGSTLRQAQPDAGQLGAWRSAAQQAAAQQAGYAYHAYALLKLEATLDAISRAAIREAPDLPRQSVRARLGQWAAANLRLTSPRGDGLSTELVAFLRAHDAAYRQRRLRYLIARLDCAREDLPEVPEAAHDRVSAAAWQALSLSLETGQGAGGDAMRAVLAKPGAALRAMAGAQGLEKLDRRVDGLLAEAMADGPPALGQRVMLAYLGFAFYDAATLALTQQNDLAETSPVRIDRICPLDWQTDAEQDGAGRGLARRLKGESFHQFGAFFSRAYREHDYLMGRLHGAARMLDILLSACPVPLGAEAEALRQQAFAAILDEEAPRLTMASDLIAALRVELGC